MYQICDQHDKKNTLKIKQVIKFSSDQVDPCGYDI